MAVDFYLDLGDIKGESQDSKHTDQITVMSFSWGGSQTTTVHGTGKGSGAGKASLADFSIMKYVDTATPKLLTAMTTGEHIAKGTLYAIKAGSKGDPFITLELDELFVTSIQVSGSSEVPMESVSFSYNKASLTYGTQDATGAVVTAGTWTFDLQTNVSS